MGVEHRAGKGLCRGLGPVWAGDGDTKGARQAVVGKTMGTVLPRPQISEQRNAGASRQGGVPAVHLPVPQPLEKIGVVVCRIDVCMVAGVGDEQIQVVLPRRGVDHRDGDGGLGPAVGGGGAWEHHQAEQNTHKQCKEMPSHTSPPSFPTIRPHVKGSGKRRADEGIGPYASPLFQGRAATGRPYLA